MGPLMVTGWVWHGPILTGQTKTLVANQNTKPTDKGSISSMVMNYESSLHQRREEELLSLPVPVLKNALKWLGIPSPLISKAELRDELSVFALACGEYCYLKLHH